MKSAFTLILFLSFCVIISSCNSITRKQKEGQEISTDQPIIQVLELETYLNQLKEEKRPHHFVDVRTPEEVAEGTITGASTIDYKADDFIEKFTALDKDQPVYLFCRSGNRSGKATKLLVAEGFKEIYDLKGGYLEYSANKE